MAIYKGDKKGIILKGDRKVVEMYKGENKLFGYDGFAEGSAIAISDAHSVGHKMKLDFSSKNLFDISQNKFSGNSRLVAKDDTSITVSQTGASRYLSANFALPNDLVGKTITVSADVVTSGANAACLRAQWLKESAVSGSLIISSSVSTQEVKRLSCTGVVPEAPEGYTQYGLLLYSNSNTSGLDANTEYTATYSNIQVEIGDTVTRYTPYMTEVRDTTITRYGKNLFDIDNIVQYQRNHGYGNYPITKVGDMITTRGRYGYQCSNLLPLPSGRTIYISGEVVGSDKMLIQIMKTSLDGSTSDYTGFDKLNIVGKFLLTFNVPYEEGYKFGLSIATHSAYDEANGIKDFQISLFNDGVYEPYVEAETVNIINGKAEESLSARPYTTLISQNNEINIKCEYLRN